MAGTCRGLGALCLARNDWTAKLMGMRRLLADPTEIDRVLAAGAERAREVAAPTLDEVKKIVGFWR